MSEQAMELDRSDTVAELQGFDEVYLELKNALLKIGHENAGTIEAFMWFEKVLNHNVYQGGGKLARRLVTAYTRVVKNPTPFNMKMVHVVGWCMEMFQASFQMSYDYIIQRQFNDQGERCWHRAEDVGILAVNDSVSTKSGMHYILKKYLTGQPYYKEVVELFLEITLHRMVGQCMEFNMFRNGQPDFHQFTMEKYTALTERESSDLRFCLPITAALYMAGITDSHSISWARMISLKMGQLSQMQEDHRNCFGVTGRRGGDIRDKKCTWFIVKALELASDKQRDELMACYGHDDDGCVERVMEVYTCLGLQAEYKRQEEQLIDSINKLVDSHQRPVPKAVGDLFSTDMIWQRLME